MHIIRNERRVRMLSSIGQYMTLAGVVILVIGLIISVTRPEWGVLALACMALGFTFSTVGGFFAGRYVGPLAHHTALVEILKGLDHRHVLFQYVLPVPQVLLEPGGCTIFVVKSQEGQDTSYEVLVPPAEKGSFTHDVTTKQPSELEIRTYRRGSGRVAVHAIKIERTE